MIPELSRLEFLENFQQPVVLYQMQRTTPLGREIEQGIANLSLLRTLLAKNLEITMSWLVCLRFSMSWCFSPRILMSQLFSLGISMSRFFGLEMSLSWFFGLGISMSWYMCFRGLVFVIINCPNLCNIYLHNICISELE